MYASLSLNNLNTGSNRISIIYRALSPWTRKVLSWIILGDANKIGTNLGLMYTYTIIPMYTIWFANIILLGEWIRPFTQQYYSYMRISTSEQFRLHLNGIMDLLFSFGFPYAFERLAWLDMCHDDGMLWNIPSKTVFSKFCFVWLKWTVNISNDREAPKYLAHWTRKEFLYTCINLDKGASK